MKENFKSLIGVIVGGLIIYAFVVKSCNTIDRITPAEDLTRLRTIEYKVDGACVSASLTYRNIQGGTEQIHEAKLPWSYKETMTTERLKKTFLYISAQNECRKGEIVSSIYVDGIEIKTSRSKGAYVIASASTSYPPRD